MVIKRLVFLATAFLLVWIMLFYIFPEVYLWFSSPTNGKYISQMNNEQQSSEVDSLLARNLSIGIPGIPKDKIANVPAALEREVGLTDEETTNTDFIILEGEKEGEELQIQALVSGEYQSREYLRTWGWLQRHKIDFKVLSDSRRLEKLARLKVDQRLFNSANSINDKQEAGKWANAIQVIDQQQGVGKYLIPYPLNLFKDPWSPAETLMSKNLGEVENQLVYVLKGLIDRKALFNDDEQNAYLELKQLVPEP